MHCDAVCGGEVREKIMWLTELSASFQSLLHYPQANWILSVLISRWGVCVHSITLWVSPVNSPVKLGVSPTTTTLTGFYKGFEAFFSSTGTLGCVVCLAPQSFLLVYPQASVGLLGLPADASLTQSSSHCLAMGLLSPSCLSLPLLTVWMNISSLTPWLLDFYMIWISGSSGCFLFLNLSLSFFWLSREAKWIYLCLHFGCVLIILTMAGLFPDRSCVQIWSHLLRFFF